MNKDFHFWVDSEYVYKLLTGSNQPSKHFFTTQDILHLASHLNYNFKHSFTIHRISSHLERYSAGACSIPGSIEADARASHACTIPDDTPFQSVEKARAIILNKSALLVQKISGLIYSTLSGPSDEHSCSDDDFSRLANAEQDLQSDPVLHPSEVSGVS